VLTSSAWKGMAGAIVRPMVWALLLLIVATNVPRLYRLPFGPKGRGDETAPCLRTSAFLYVNRGLGTFGLAVRLGVPPEITVLTLRAAG
jgi:predicted MPP superfamily phosphohydrolase